MYRNGVLLHLLIFSFSILFVTYIATIMNNIQTGRKEDETNFPPCEAGQSKTPRSARKLWRNSLDDMSRLATPDDFKFSSSQPDPELLVEQEASM